MEFDDRKLIFFALSLNIFLVIHNYIVYENIENFDLLSNEAIQNIGSILNTKTLTVDNLIVTNQITSSIIKSKELNSNKIITSMLNADEAVVDRNFYYHGRY